MKNDIHPKYYSEAKIQCACGNVMVIGSTMAEIQVEICSKCHPFYTGTQRIIDTARRVDKYQKRLEQKELNKDRKGKKAKRATRSLKKKTGSEEETVPVSTATAPSELQQSETTSTETVQS